MTDPELRKLRHDIRGSLHGLQLCVSVLERPLPREDAIEFLADIINAAEKTDQLLAQVPITSDEPAESKAG